MKKILLIAVFALSFAFIGLSHVQAACADSDVLCNGQTGGGTNPTTNSSPCANTDATAKPSFCKDDNTGKANPITGPKGVLTEVTNLVLYIVGILAVIMVIISGIRMATSNGDPQAFSSARTGLIYALLGIAVAILARAIVLFIVGRI